MDEDDLNEKKAMDDVRDEKRKKKKVKGNIKGKKTITALVIKAILSMLTVLLIASSLGLLYEGTTYVLELIRSVDDPNETLETLGVDKLQDLVEIKGNVQTGYYYAYDEDFEQKIEKLAEKTVKEHNLPGMEADLIKKMIRAELVNEFPNLGANIGDNNANVEVMLQKAKQNANYMRKNGWSYGNSPVNPAMDKTVKIVSCDRFVGWVLYDMGYTNQPKNFGLPLGKLQSFLEQIGWQKITDPDEYKAGDIIFTRPSSNGSPQHTFICAGKGSKKGSYLRYDAGSDERIQGQQPYDEPITEFVYLYRMPENSVNVTNLSSVLFIGDSITNGLGQSGTIEGIFRGVDNSTPAQWNNNTNSNNGEPTYSTLPNNSNDIQALCVMIGTNNPYQISDTKSLLGKLHDKYPNKTIYVQKILPLSSPNAPEDIEKAKQYNSELMSFCSSSSYAKFIDATNNVQIDVNDGTHPTTEGYAQLAENLKELLLNGELTIGEDDGLQGNIKIRRVTPNKAIGEFRDISGGVVSLTQDENISSDGLGTKQDIPDSIKGKMEGISMRGVSGTTYDDLSYLTIPYYDFAGNIQNGHMIVNKKLADEVLLIFQDLYKIKYPIQKMELVDDYGSRSMSSDDIDWASIDANNTSAFNDRASITANGSGGSISKHALGQAIDINPLINPYIRASDGQSSHSVSNDNYIKNRDTLQGWSGVAKEAVINKKSKIYDIFVNKYGWTWLGDGACGGDSDTQHFEKANLSNVKTINWSAKEKVNEKTNNSNSNSGSKGVIVLDPGHGKTLSGSEYKANGFVQNSSGQWGEWRHWKSGTYGQECGGSGCCSRCEAGPGASEWYPMTSGLRDTEPEINWNNAMAAKKYLEEMGYTVRVTRTQNNHPSFAQRSTYCFPNQDTSKEPDADLYVCIHSNAEGGRGTSYIALSGTYDQKYIPSDYVAKSNKAGEIINKKVAEASGLQLNGPIQGEPDLIAFHKNTCPTAYLEIGFFDNANDLAILRSKSDDIGRAIANGVNEYMGSPAANINSSNSTKTASSVNSQIYDLRYVPEDTFDQYVKENNQEAIRTFTLDKEGRLITARWSSSGGGQVSIYKNSPVNFKTTMYKYVTSYEYMLNYWIDIKETDFIYKFINNVIDSDFVITIQDDVTTTETVTTTTVMDASGAYVSGGTETIFSETVNDKIELTYADTWFVTVSKDFSFETATLQSTASSGSTLTGTMGKLIADDFRLTGYCPCAECSNGYGKATASGATCTANRTVAVDRNLIPLGTKLIIEGFSNVFVAEDVGGGVNGHHIDIYVNSHPETFYPQYNMSGRKVWIAENVTEGGSAFQGGGSFIINAITNVPGKVTISQSSSSSSSTSEDGTTTIVTTSTNTVSNEYDVGEDYHVYSKEKEFVKLFKDYPEAKRRIKPKWLVKCVEKNAIQMLDLTKFFMNELMDEEIFPDIDKDIIFERYRKNEFITIDKNARISYESIAITEEDRQILYKITSAQRGGGTEDQQKYMASLVLNRVLSSQFPNTVKEVVFAPDQFEAVKTGAYDSAIPSEETKKAVDDVIENGGTAKTAVFFMTPESSLILKDWVDKSLIFLFNDEKESLKDTNTTNSYNFYTTESIQAELEQYMMTSVGDIVDACEDVMNVWMSRGVRYSLTTLPTTLKQAYETTKYGCCATYVCTVLYRAGLLDEADVAGQSWHWTGSDGVPAILLRKGWKKVSKSNLQPGDVLNANTVHVLIYAGKGIMYDQSCAVYSSSGTPPIGGPLPASRYNYYMNNPAYEAYRAP